MAGFLAAAASATTYTVRPDGSGDFPTIQAAVDAADDGDVVELTAGTFTGAGNRDIQVPARGITIRSQTGDPSACVIDCEGAAPGFCVRPSAAGTVLHGVTVSRGNAKWGGGGLSVQGSGVYVPLVVRDCIFQGNSAEAGGSVFDLESSLFQRCRFVENSARAGGAYYAGGMSSSDVQGRFEECAFIGNVAIWSGAAAYLETVPLGGPAALQRHDGVFSNCLFARNSASIDGVILLHGVSPLITECTFADNTVTDGAIISCRWGGLVGADPLISRSIIAFSSPGRAVDCDPASHPTLACCDLFENAEGDWAGCIASLGGMYGNFSADPRFCDPAAGDYRLAEDSPCSAENNPGCAGVGAFPVGCAGPVPVEALRWGGLKWRYR